KLIRVATVTVEQFQAEVRMSGALRVHLAREGTGAQSTDGPALIFSPLVGCVASCECPDRESHFRGRRGSIPATHRRFLAARLAVPARHYHVHAVFRKWVAHCGEDSAAVVGVVGGCPIPRADRVASAAIRHGGAGAGGGGARRPG